MNWGKGIIIGMGLFMAFILTLVIIMMRQDIDLVQDDYYQQELAFDKQYNAEKVYIESEDSITMNVDAHLLKIKLGKAFQQDSVQIDLKRPNNREQDMTFRMKAMPEIAIPTEKLPQGIFQCYVYGTLNGKKYQFNETVFIP